MIYFSLEDYLINISPVKRWGIFIILSIIVFLNFALEFNQYCKSKKNTKEQTVLKEKIINNLKQKKDSFKYINLNNLSEISNDIISFNFDKNINTYLINFKIVFSKIYEVFRVLKNCNNNIEFIEIKSDPSRYILFYIGYK